MDNCDAIKLIVNNISADGVNALATFIGLGFAIYAFSKWRIEHIGKKKIDLFEKVYPSLKLIEVHFNSIFIEELSSYELDDFYSTHYSPDEEFKNIHINYIIYRLNASIFSKALDEIKQNIVISDAYLNDHHSESFKEIYYIRRYLIKNFSESSKEELIDHLNILNGRLISLNKYICSVISGKSR
jgi:hypothetical protein